jgi:hypothetical protein
MQEVVKPWRRKRGNPFPQVSEYASSTPSKLMNLSITAHQNDRFSATAGFLKKELVTEPDRTEGETMDAAKSEGRRIPKFYRRIRKYYRPPISIIQFRAKDLKRRAESALILDHYEPPLHTAANAARSYFDKLPALLKLRRTGSTNGLLYVISSRRREICLFLLIPSFIKGGLGWI